MTTQTYDDTTATPGIGARVLRFFRLLGHALVLIAESDSRLRRMRYLQARSDAELAEMGLTRDRIAHHVFQNHPGI